MKRTVQNIAFAFSVCLVCTTTISCGRRSAPISPVENDGLTVLSELSPSTSTDGTSTDVTSTAANTLFQPLTVAECGIDFVNRIDNDHPLSRLYISGFAAGGVAIGDVDGDGLPDIYLTGGPADNRLYRQVSDLHFADVTEQAGVAATGRWSASAAMSSAGSL